MLWFHVVAVELLIASQDKIEMFSFHADEFDDEHDVIHDQEDKNIAASSVLYHLHQKVFYLCTLFEENLLKYRQKHFEAYRGGRWAL